MLYPAELRGHGTGLYHSCVQVLMARRGQAKKRGTRDMMRGMQLRKGPTGGMILAAALFLCVCPVGPGVAEAEPDCPVPPGQEIVVTRATAGGTLITADGAEIVLGGLHSRK